MFKKLTVFLFILLMIPVNASAYTWGSATVAGKTPVKVAGKTMEYVNGMTSITVVSGTLYMAYNAGGSMMFHGTIDFSGSQSSGGVATTYVSLYAASGVLVASAYAGAVGGGENLDIELITNGGFETSDPPSSWTPDGNETISRQADPRTGSVGSYCIDVTRGSSGNKVYQDSLTVTQGALYKIDFWGKKVSGGSYSVQLVQSIWAAGWWSSGSLTNTSWAETYGYATCPYSTAGIGLIVNTAATHESRFDDLSVKKITDIPNTGLKLYAEKTLATQSLTSQPGIASVNAGVQVVLKQVNKI